MSKYLNLNSCVRISNPILFEGQRVLEEEAAALLKLSTYLNNAFEKAVKIILSLKGNLIISGIGKSAHIARKISSTMSSTGTSSFFIHATEASHGDLGMISTNDAVLLLSNSGETYELFDIISYTKQFNIPLLSITGSKVNTLMELSDISLPLPPLFEACPLGVCPTTSTTVMLGMGDALAISLIQQRNFSIKDFTVFHPGGKLGKSFLRIKKLMHTGDKIPLIYTFQSMKEILLEMTKKRFGCVGVLNEQDILVGIITDGDLRRCMDFSNFLNAKAEEIMTIEPKTVSSQMLASEVIGFMNNQKITTLFVVNNKKDLFRPIGIVHIHDCLRAGFV